MIIKRWQLVSLIILQAMFAACASSVLVYNAFGWAPDVISFEWGSYRAFNIYVSILIVAALIWGLVARVPIIMPVIIVFATFHLVEGLIISFWSKAAIHFVTLIIAANIQIQIKQKAA
ncbi:MAG: hypothetical protein JJ855_18965 [Rhodospirillales bacterium]|nr:hypothetical protein [Rhodospirillales bacterium]